MLRKEDFLSKALYSGLIEEEDGAWKDLEPRLIQNNGFRQETVLASLLDNLQNCHGFYWAVAFITDDALAMLKLIWAELAQRGVRGKLLTSNYLCFNQPKVYRELLKIKNIDVVILEGAFHIKGYGFDLGTYQSFIMGSANLTGNALKCNFEWNVELKGKAEGSFFKNIKKQYQELFKQGIPLSPQWLEEYSAVYEAYKASALKPEIFSGQQSKDVLKTEIMPNPMQREALLNLAKLRKQGEKRGLLISATGTGKTYLASFHIKEMAPKRMLFIAHREELLYQAQRTMKRILGGKGDEYGILSGNSKDYGAKYLFATVQTLSKDDVLASFSPDEFPAIILDEVHHGGADSYQRLINYFKPEFLLGMTATPERRDNFNIYELFAYQIIYEIRLQDALEQDLLCPFHYYGLRDFTVDNELITENTQFNKLTHDERVKHLLAMVEYYGYSGGKLKGLCFCSSVAEAKALAKAFTAKGIVAKALSGEDSPGVRAEILEELAKEDSPLKYIFTVDIFNEGVDIPQLNQIMMLRPTTSPTIFIQQLGRGLRKYSGKHYVTILDFIGNYQSACNIPVALSGDISYNKDKLRRYLRQGINYLPGLSTINFTQVVKEQIFNALDKVKWDKLQLLQGNYLAVKEKLGKIPTMAELQLYGKIDPRLYFTHKNAYLKTKGATSYYGFLARYDKEYQGELGAREELLLGYISQKFALGKRRLDWEVLSRLPRENSVMVQDKQEIILNLAKLLNNDFNTTVKIKEVFAGANLATLTVEESSKVGMVKGIFKATLILQAAYQSKVFKKFYDELIAYAKGNWQDNYGALYEDTPFAYAGKYTYEEICSLLAWDVNIPSLNIGGYKWDKQTDTMPIFINYHTGEKYKRKIDYEHGFKDRNHFTCYSKPRRNLESPEFKRLANYEKASLPIYLFVRKNKDDTQTAKEFYFLGKMVPAKMVEVELPNGLPGVEMNFKLVTPVEASLYEYLIRE